MDNTNTYEWQESVPLLDEKQAAAWLNCSVAALRKWRLKGQGPVFYRVGSRLIRYRVRDLGSFVEGGQLSIMELDEQGGSNDWFVAQMYAS